MLDKGEERKVRKISLWRRFKIWMTWDYLRTGLDYRGLPPQCKEHTWVDEKCFCGTHRVGVTLKIAMPGHR